MSDEGTNGSADRDAASLRVALLSRWHVHADDYAREARALGLDLVTVWDEDPVRGRTWAAELGIPFQGELSAVLADDGVDAVIVDTATQRHLQVLSRAAEAGKHIFSEKVLAASSADCETIFAAVDAAGVELMLSLPRLAQPAYLAAQAALDGGELGRLTALRCRVAHDGAVVRDGRAWLPPRFLDPLEALGGALIDLGAHPLYLCNRLAGRPSAVSAQLASVMGHAVDDNSVALISYPNGVLAVAETGFVSARSDLVLELHGTDGSLLIEGIDAPHIRLQRHGEGWRELDPPPAQASPMAQWLAAISGHARPNITRQDMLDLTRVNEAAARSAREGRRVAL